MSSPQRRQFAKRRLDELIVRFAESHSSPLDPYWRLIDAVRARSRLLVPFSNRGWSDPDNAEQVVRACVRMADRLDRWRSAPEVWSAPDAGPFVQFRSLASHLFDSYRVPNFMAPVWMSTADQPWEVDLYLHLASGRSVRQFKLPAAFDQFLCTKKVAALFMQAPDDSHPIQALRWAHVRSLGGDKRVARLLSRWDILALPSEQEDFWETVIRFLIRNSPISSDEIRQIVRFIDRQRFQPAETVWGPGGGQQPLQPEFTLQGRSLMSLRRHMANWRTELAERRSVPPPPLTRPWPPTPIKPFRHMQGDALWTIDELLTDQELRIEGGIMRHCVGSYSYRCARRWTSIWSMRMQQGECRKRVLTIEVGPSDGTIWEAKGRRNSPPTETARQLLEQWAHQEGLKLAEDF